MSNKKIKAELLKDFEIIKSLEKQYPNIANSSAFVSNYKVNIDKLRNNLKTLESNELFGENTKLDTINEDSPNTDNEDIKSGKALKEAFEKWSTEQIAALKNIRNITLKIEYNEILILVDDSIKGTSNILLKNIFTEIKNATKNYSQNIGGLCMAITDVLQKYNDKKGLFFFNYYLKNYKSYRKDADNTFYKSLEEFNLIQLIEKLIAEHKKDVLIKEEEEVNKLTALLNKTALEQDQRLLQQMQGYIDGKFSDLESLSVEHLNILQGILQAQSNELKAIGINTQALQQKINMVNVKLNNISANVVNVQKSLDKKFPEAAGKIIFDEMLHHSAVPLSLALVYKYEESDGIKIPIIFNGEAYGSPSIANMTFKEYSIMNISAAKVNKKLFTVTHEIDVRCHVIQNSVEDKIIDEDTQKMLKFGKYLVAVIKGASSAFGKYGEPIAGAILEPTDVFLDDAIEDNKKTQIETQDTLFFMKYVVFISFDPENKKGPEITFTRKTATNKDGEVLPIDLEHMIFKGNTKTLPLK